MSQDEQPLDELLRERYGDLGIERPSWGSVAYLLAAVSLGFVLGVVGGVARIAAVAKESRRYDDNALLGGDGEVVFEISAATLGDAVAPLIGVGMFAFTAAMLTLAALEWRRG